MSAKKMEKDGFPLLNKIFVGFFFYVTKIILFDANSS